MLRFFGLLLFSLPALGNNVVQHSGAWFMYFGDHAWSEHWGLHAEAQVRRVDGVLKGQQLLLRPGINYRVNSHLTFMGGYTNVQNYSFDSLSYRRRIHEHRIHQEATASHPLAKLKLQHRFRLEQRFGGYSGDWQYRNRFRYRLLVNVPVSRLNYFAAYNEVFANFGSRATRAFDQSRVYGAVGHDFGTPGRLEVGYLFQRQQVSDLSFRQVHAVQIAFFSKIALRKQP